MKSAEIAKELRGNSGLSVRKFAAAAGVSPSTVHRVEKGAMEPTVELLSDLAAAAGERLVIHYEPDYAMNIAGLAQSIRADLLGSDESMIVRKAAEFVHRFMSSDRTTKQWMVNPEPPATQNKKWDAFLAALVEWLAIRAKIKPPPWVYEKSRFLEKAWWVSPMPSLRAHEYAGSHAAFQNRGVYLHRESLENV